VPGNETNHTQTTFPFQPSAGKTTIFVRPRLSTRAFLTEIKKRLYYMYLLNLFFADPRIL